jgi:hypothetical protein
LPKRARAARAGSREGLDRSVLVTLEYAEGPVATLAYSWDSANPLSGEHPSIRDLSMHA